MAGKRPINVVIQGEYTDKDVKRAIADLKSLQNEAPAAGNSFGGLGNTLKALGGIMAATFTVGAVTDFFKDSIRGAMEDQKSMTALATAMSNVGLASKNAASEDLIKAMSMQYGIADDQLRPAYQRLITATRDVGQSQSLLRTALDLSAAGYADTESAAKALSAAAMGNFTALQRLKVPIDANTIAAKDFEGAIKQLNAVVGGQAAAAAETYQGKLNRITVAAGEAKETVGYALLQALDAVSASFGGTGGLTAAIDTAGNAMGNFVRGIGAGVFQLGLWVKAVQNATSANGGMELSLWDIARTIYRVTPGAGLLLDIWERLSKSGEHFVTPERDMRGYTDAISAYEPAAQRASRFTEILTGSFDGAARGADNAAGAVAGLSTALAVYSKVGYTPGGVMLAGMSEADFKHQQLVDQMKAALGAARQSMSAIQAARQAASSGGKSGSKKAKSPIKEAADDFVLLDDSAKRALQGVNEMSMGYDDLTRSLGADDIASFSRSMLAMGQVTDTTKSEFESMVGVVRDKLNKALSDAREVLNKAQQAYDDFNSRVQQGITAGNGLADAAQSQADAVQKLADAQKAYDDAVKGGKPEDIEAASKALADAKGQQGTFLSFLQKGVDTAEAFSGQIQELVRANASLELVSQIVQMGAKTGGRVAAELLAGGAEAINQANRMVDAVRAAAATAGEMAAQTFYGAGLASATAYVTALETQVQPLLQNLLNSIAAQIAAALRQPVNANLGSGAPTNPTTAAIAAPFSAALGAYAPKTPGAGPNIPSGEGRIYAELMALSRRAAGGPVSSGTPYIVGEVGPELFIPGSSGSIVPNKSLGGNTYQITVQAGVGDPRQIGQQIVEYITRWENANGQRYARTA